MEADAGDLLQGVGDDLGLEFELCPVAQVLDLAAAAAGEVGAARADALVGGGQYFQRLGVADVVFDLQGPEFDLFPHCRIRGEEHRLAEVNDTLSVAPQRFDLPRKFQVFCCDLRCFRHVHTLTLAKRGPLLFCGAVRVAVFFHIFAAEAFKHVPGVFSALRVLRRFFSALLPLAAAYLADVEVDQALRALHQPVVKKEHGRPADGDDQVRPIVQPCKRERLRRHAAHGAKQRPARAQHAHEPHVFDGEGEPAVDVVLFLQAVDQRVQPEESDKREQLVKERDAVERQAEQAGARIGEEARQAVLLCQRQHEADGAAHIAEHEGEGGIDAEKRHEQRRQGARERRQGDAERILFHTDPRLPRFLPGLPPFHGGLCLRRLNGSRSRRSCSS